jgi:acyl-homoserine lactone acylase PvdQ
VISVNLGDSNVKNGKNQNEFMNSEKLESRDNMPTEVLFGFLGLIAGAIIGFGGDVYINNRKMKFEAYKDVKLTLSKMHNRLVELHSKIQQFYTNEKTGNARDHIIYLKDYHWSVMEIYKEFRIYFGDMKAYELQSAVYNYYYEYAKDQSNEENFDKYFFFAYQALKDAYGLMISEVKLGLVNVNFIKKADKKLEKNKLQEYKKYADRLKVTLEGHLAKDALSDHSIPTVNQAASVVKERLSPFEEEYQRKFR